MKRFKDGRQRTNIPLRLGWVSSKLMGGIARAEKTGLAFLSLGKEREKNLRVCVCVCGVCQHIREKEIAIFQPECVCVCWGQSEYASIDENV